MNATPDPDVPFLDPAAPVAIQRLQRLLDQPAQALDELPIGVIQVDREGTILTYNQAEARLAGLDAASVIGKNFFTEVAPCTNVQEFAGRFRSELGADAPPVVFPYDFEFPDRRVHVMVLLHYDPAKERGWILVQETPGLTARYWNRTTTGIATFDDTGPGTGRPAEQVEEKRDSPQLQRAGTTRGRTGSRTRFGTMDPPRTPRPGSPP